MKKAPEPIMSFLIHTRNGVNYFAFLDPELGLVFPEGTPSKTQAAFRGWFEMQDKETITVGIRVSQLLGSYYLRVD